MDLLHDHVGQQGDDSPFVMIASLAAESIHRHASRLLEKLQEECRVVFHGMSERFGVIRDEAVDDDEAVAETKLGLRDYLVEVDDEIAKIIQSLKTIEKDDVRKAKPKSSPSHFIKQEDVEEASVLEPGLRPFKATKESDQQADGPGSAAQYDSPPNKKLKLSLKFKSEECEEKNSGE